MRVWIKTGTVLLALLFAAGCGGGSTDPALAGADCVNGAPGKGGDVTVTAADNGRRFCLDRDGTVRVSLPGTPGAPVTVTGAALAEVSEHVFRGVSAGTAVLASAVRSCPEPTPTPPGSLSCLAMVAWQVTVVVR